LASPRETSGAPGSLSRNNSAWGEVDEEEKVEDDEEGEEIKENGKA
jgi:hypothetical protein